MNHPSFSNSRPRRKRGMALLMVLSCLALLAMLVLALLSMSRTERQAATTFADSVAVRNLSEMPANLVMAQIRKATEQLGVEKTWASQPGMIRVYGVEPDGSGQRAKATALYKLYSDDQMVVTKSGASSTSNGLSPSEVGNALRDDTKDLANWDKQIGVFTDLNEPVPVLRDGTTPAYEFPVVDPRAAATGDSMAVEGFHYDDGAVPGAVAPHNRDDLQSRLPMPVRWLYVLRDGSMATPLSSSNGTVRFAGAGPTRENPIVGRVAFWTDDESTKVNVNTAGEGTAWAVPRANTVTERDAARKMPVRNEFARYPGHPAMTCLSPVFQAFGSDFVLQPWTSGTTRADRVKRYHELNPRLMWGGTQGGTVSSLSAIFGVRSDRLYATLDELMFDRDRDVNNSQIDARDLSIGKFFLTTHSRAPELNLFNKPRIGLWPVSKASTERNAQDKLLAFLNSAGVDGGGVRSDGWSFYRATNADIAAGKPGSSQSTSDDLSTSIRNDSLMNSYLAFLTGQPNGTKKYLIPGFGHRTMLEKYGREKRDQILTEMFDMIRCGVAAENVSGTPAYRFLPAHNDTQTNPTRRGESSAVPIVTYKDGDFQGFNTNVSNSVGKNTKGFGRFPTITEATLAFIATANSGKDKNGDGRPDTTKMRAFLIVEPFSPTCGSPAWTATWRYRVLFHNQSGNNWKAQRVGAAAPLPMQFPPSASAAADDPDADFTAIKGNWPTNMVNAPIDMFEGGNMTPFSGLLTQFKKAYLTSTPTKPLPGKVGIKPMNNLPSSHSDPALGFPFYSELIDVTDKQQFDFTGGEMVIALFTGWTNTDVPVQKLRLKFPNARLKVPTLTSADYAAGYTTLSTRFSKDAEQLREVLIRPGDITRSVEVSADGPSKGDLRHLAAIVDVPDSYFAPSPGYNTTTVEQNHGLRDGAWTDKTQVGGVKTSDTAGKLVAGITYPDHCPPAVPRGMNGALNSKGRPGDWDTGVGLIEDGPFINKPDEANVLLEDGGYFQRGGEFAKEDGSSFAPNRQICSAAAFGSLPTGINPAKPLETEPWQTLLFCPNPPSRTTAALDEPNSNDHKGFESPRDHLLLDLFWMPVVEPYAISEAFSTAGKINMNYQLMPFTYLERSTGMHAALKSLSLGAIPPDAVTAYKNPTAPYWRELRYFVNTPETLKGFEQRFSRSDLFRSPSEICNIFLVPQRKPGGNYGGVAPAGYESMTMWWNGILDQPDANELTGDNMREEPYGVLYPRLTTQSNTFTVHYRVQSLQKARSTDAGVWVEEKDRIASDYRGSMTLERYMDPNELEIGEIGVGSGTFANTWDTHFRIRIVQRKQFTP